MQTQMNVAARNYTQQICEDVLATINKDKERDNANAIERLLAHWPDTRRENAMCMLRVRGFVTKIKRGIPYFQQVTARGYEFLRTGIVPHLMETLAIDDAIFDAEWKARHANG